MDDNIAAQILQQGFSVTYDKTRTMLDYLITHEMMPESEKEERIKTSPYLASEVIKRRRGVHRSTVGFDEYCRDLTKKAQSETSKTAIR